MSEAPVETTLDFGNSPSAVVSRWREEIKLYDREYDIWAKSADKIVKRYRDERDSQDSTRRLNVLWSNVQTLKPAIYGRTPKSEVRRRFKDRDPVGRLAAEILERGTDYCVDAYDFNGTMEAVVEDRILVGRGASWARYIPVYGEEQGEGDDAYKPVDFEQTTTDYVHWKDFGHTVARCWNEVGAVWKKEYLSRDALIKRFGAVLGKEVPLNHQPPRMDEESLKSTGDVFKKALVYEIWDKENRQAIWICLDYPDRPLDTRDDPLGLRDFFPCPRPLYATTTNNTLVPVPDYKQYQDQAQEIDDLTARIDLLVSALAVSGVYDGSMEGISKLLDRAKDSENTLIPVDSWAVLADKGGLKGVIDWLPIDQIAVVLAGLYEARKAAKEELFEVSGLADIIRGQVDPREKLGQSQIKGQFATLRLDDLRNEVARFARDALRIKAEIIAEQFSPETLGVMTNLPDLPQRPEPPMMGDQEGMQKFQMEAQKYQTDVARARQEFDQAVQLLRQDTLRSFRIDIETDSTIKIDEKEDKESRIEFLSAAAQYLNQAATTLQIMPAAGPLLGEMLLFGIRGFKAGRQLEETFEEAIEDLSAQPAQAPGQGDAQQADAMKAKIEEGRLQIEQAKMQAEGERSQAEHGLKQQDMATKADLERQKLAVTQAIEQAKLQATREIEAAKLSMERAKVGVDMEFRGKEMDFNQGNDERTATIKQGAETGQAMLKALTDAVKRIEGLPERVEAMENMLQAPKSISVKRDKSGKITGGTVKQGENTTEVMVQ